MRISPKVFALVAALVCLLAAPAIAGASSAHGGPAKAVPTARASFRIVNATQQDILRKGLQIELTVRIRKPSGRARLRKPATVRIKGLSSTFDAPVFRALTKPRTLRLRRTIKRAVTLKLTTAGRAQVRSCEQRTLRVQIGNRRANSQLKRSGSCGPQPIDLSRADDCDFIGQQGGSLCLLPFPDDYYTVADPRTATQKRIAFRDSQMPQNKDGQPIAAAPYDLNDGFSPGQTILVRIPGLDDPAAFAQTAPVPINHIGRYMDAAAPVVVIDATTGERWPIWSELDSNAATAAGTAFEIHPAKNFAARHRYIVALRDLKTADGSPISAPEGFRYYRDRLPSSKMAIGSRRSHFEGLFKTLRSSNIKRANLYLAWDFTVASDENIAQRMLHIRDDAFAQLGDTSLADGNVQGTTVPFTVDTVDTNPSAEIARRVRGTFTVPCYLTNGCVAPAVFTLDANGNPVQQGSYVANYDCIIPHAAVDDPGAGPGRPSLYGHGLLGTASEVNSAPQRTLAEAHNFVTCATDEIGFANQDVPNTIGILQDLGKFPQLTDRVQQGLLNELLLGRLMDNPSGFLSKAAFHADGTTLTSPPVIDTSKLYYNGNSQGGILGGALTAVSPDFTRASLGVPAMNYSVLLPRSTDFATYSAILYPSYPNELSRPLALDLIQMLWDRSEPDGYAHRMTDNPLPKTPQHKVLMNVAFGDHQVTNWQANVEAWTIGASAHAPVVYDGRWPDVDQLYGIPRIGSYPFDGSSIVYWDSGPTRPDPANPAGVIGTDPPPLANKPNTSGADPHGRPREDPKEQQMVSDFLRPDNISQINDTCLGRPCFAGGFKGP